MRHKHLLIIQDASPYVAILERFGLPTAMLALVLLAFWKGAWPLLIKSFEDREKILREQIAVEKERAERAERQNDSLRMQLDQRSGINQNSALIDLAREVMVIKSRIER